MPQYPAPQVPYTGYSDLYFATEWQIRSWFALGNFDRGELTIVPRRLTFRGMNVEVDCNNVSAVRLVRKTFPWGLVFVVTAAAAVFIYLNSPIPFTWRQPAIYVVAAILIVTSLRQWREEWVEVVHSNDQREQRAYFRRQPIFWGSASVCTRELNQELCQKLLSCDAN